MHEGNGPCYYKCMDFTTYNDLLDYAEDMKKRGLIGVIVFKPDCQDSDEQEDYPDIVISTSNDPNVIASLLGNPSPTTT